MRSHRRYEAAPQGQGMVWGLVLVLAGLGGAALYFLTKSPREVEPPRRADLAPAASAASATPTSPSSTAGTASATPASPEPPSAAELAVPRGPLSPKDPLPTGVSQWFDEE